MVTALAWLWAAAPLAEAGGGYTQNLQNVRWNTLTTEHFYIHWPESSLPESDPHWFTTQFTAGRLAAIAEESYPKICEQLQYFPTERTHVVVYDQNPGWEGNGFAIAEYDQTGFAADWGPLFRMRGRMEFLSDVFVHEFAHIVSLKAYQPWSEDSTGFQLGGLVEDEEWLRRWGARPSVGVAPGTKSVNFDLAADIPMIVPAPFWWAEGGAEYWSHRAGYNFWGSSRDAFLRTTWAEGRVLDLDQWTTRVDKGGFDGERGYNQGYAFGLWLAQRFPDRDVMSEAARVSGERFHFDWDKVMEEVTGVPFEELVAEWHAYLDQHYGGQQAAIDAQGRNDGRELSLTQPPWEAGDPDWAAMSPKRQAAEKDAWADAFMELPVISPDGKWMAWFDGGLVAHPTAPATWGAISGTYVADDDTKAQRAWERKAAYPAAAAPWKPDFAPQVAPGSARLVYTSYEDLAPAWREDAGLTVNADGWNWTALAVAELVDTGKRVEMKSRVIPNTLRAAEGAFHPDGQTLAFSRYGDGTHDLWTIRVDGTEATRLTDFGDGTQINGIDWSPDGRSLLVGLYRNYRQDLWLFEVAERRWTRLTDSEADEVDPTFAPDGRIWFGSDWGGAFNIYALAPESGDIRRQTNVIGGAYGPAVSAEGHLFFTDFTGHGYRIKALRKDELREEAVAYPGVCAGEGGCFTDPGEIDFRPEQADAVAMSAPYKTSQGLMRFNIWPMARLSDKNLELGGTAIIGDMTERQYLQLDATFGKDNAFSASWFIDVLPPTLSLGYSRYAYKGAYGYGDDADGLRETPDDLIVRDLKFEQLAEDVWLYASWAASDLLWISGGVDASRYSFRDTGDGGRFVPFVVNSGLGVNVEYLGYGYNDDYWINPRGGRHVYLDYGLRHTAIIDPEVGGAVIDDGEELDRYRYHRVEVGWTEYVPVSTFATLEVAVQGGWIDRNVLGWDEFIAGGRHPYDWGPGTIGSNAQFAGYEGWSLYGESMVIAAAAYRFPLARDLNLRAGPWYTDQLYLQFGGTVGNLWSYRVEGPTHIEGYNVVPSEGGSVRREIPFVDYASKNSLPGYENRILYDVGAELRVRSFLWNDFDWDGFVRLSYGFRPTAGYGDVNADLIQSSSARDASTELSAEFEPATLRVYAGLGTGW